MTKYFIVSDVHSFYDELQTALEKKGWDPKDPSHVFVSLGDLLDRGPDAVKCLQFVNGLPNKKKILILGNHEDLMIDAQMYQRFGMHDIHNRTDDTCYQIVDYLKGYDVADGESCKFYLSEEEILNTVRDSEIWNTYYDSCVDYAEIVDNIFVHGWIPCDIEYSYNSHSYDIKNYTYLSNWRESSKWRDARWINGMDAWNNGVREPGKTIWAGHWHTSWGHANIHNDGQEWLDKIETYYQDENGVVHPYAKFTPFKDDGIVAMDACTAYSNFVNCEVLEI